MVLSKVVPPWSGSRGWPGLGPGQSTQAKSTAHKSDFWMAALPLLSGLALSGHRAFGHGVTWLKGGLCTLQELGFPVSLRC